MFNGLQNNLKRMKESKYLSLVRDRLYKPRKFYVQSDLNGGISIVPKLYQCSSHEEIIKIVPPQGGEHSLYPLRSGGNGGSRGLCDNVNTADIDYMCTLGFKKTASRYQCAMCKPHNATPHSLEGAPQVIGIGDTKMYPVFGACESRGRKCVSTFILDGCNPDRAFRFIKELVTEDNKDGNKIAKDSTILYFSLSHLLEAGSVDAYLREIRGLKYKLAVEVFGFNESTCEPRINIAPVFCPIKLNIEKEKKIFGQLTDTLTALGNHILIEPIFAGRPDHFYTIKKSDRTFEVSVESWRPNGKERAQARMLKGGTVLDMLKSNSGATPNQWRGGARGRGAARGGKGGFKRGGGQTPPPSHLRSRVEVIPLMDTEINAENLVVEEKEYTLLPHFEQLD